MNKEFEMELILGIAIVLAAAGLFYLKFINTPKIEEPKEDPAIVELRKEIKAINEDINELMKIRDDQFAINKSLRSQIQGVSDVLNKSENEKEKLVESFKEIETKFKMVNTQVVRLQSSMLKGPANVNVKIEGPVQFEMKKPEVTPAPANPPSKGKGVKKLLDQVGI